MIFRHPTCLGGGAVRAGTEAYRCLERPDRAETRIDKPLTCPLTGVTPKARGVRSCSRLDAAKRQPPAPPTRLAVHSGERPPRCPPVKTGASRVYSFRAACLFSQINDLHSVAVEALFFAGAAPATSGSTLAN